MADVLTIDPELPLPWAVNACSKAAVAACSAAAVAVTWAWAPATAAALLASFWSLAWMLCRAIGSSVLGSTPARMPSTSEPCATCRVIPPSAPRAHRKTKTTTAASTPRTPAMAKGGRKPER